MSTSYPKYTIEEEKAIFEKIKAEDESARDKFIIDNMNLIYKVANEFYKFKNHKEDLISEGKMGLLEAVYKFDPSKGNRFSTYAYRVIKGAMLTYLKENCINMFDELDESRFESIPYVETSDNTKAKSTVITILNDPEYKKSTSERDQEIVRSLFGIDCIELKNKEVAHKYGMSKGRVSHIKTDFLKRVKILNKLEGDVDNSCFKEQPEGLDIESDKEILEYLNIMAEESYRAFYGFDEEGEPEWGLSNAPQRFITRYNLNHILFKKDYSRFYENSSIHKMIKELNIDITKFWYLILFLHDDAYHYYKNNIKSLPSPFEQLLPIYLFAQDHIEEGLTVKINDAPSFRIESRGLGYLSKIFERYILHIEDNEVEGMCFMSGYPEMDKSVTKDNIYIIKKFANSLLDFFSVYPTVMEKRNIKNAAELSLISHLIYFFKLSDKMGYLTGNDAINKALNYKTEEINVINNIY